jgi:hypothetical protein
MIRVSIALCLWTLVNAFSVARGQVEVDNLTASDAAAGDQFGLSVAARDDLILIAAPFKDGAGQDSGAVYVFRNDSGQWLEQAKLTASDAMAGAEFGIQVALGDDIAVIGAPGDGGHGPGAGAAYVFCFDRTNMTWTEEAKLTASDAAAGDAFGRSVSIDGEVIAVGAPRKDGPLPDVGRAYVFERQGTAWPQQAILASANPSDDGEFGQSVGVDGDTVVVGAWLEDAFDWNAGAAYAFRRDANTAEWPLEGILGTSDADAGDVLGYALDLENDVVVIGALAAEVGAAFDTGAAYVFMRAGGIWTEHTKLTASDPADFDAFGSAVSLDGNTIVIGALVEDDCPFWEFCDTGAAYVFDFDGAVWTQQAKLTASDANNRDEFGVSVAASGETIAIGAFWNDDDGEDSGSTYIFESDAVDCLADMNGDQVLDLEDLGLFISCFGGPQVTIEPGCEPADLDGDADADLYDFSVFQRVFGTDCVNG